MHCFGLTRKGHYSWSEGVRAANNRVYNSRGCWRKELDDVNDLIIIKKAAVKKAGCASTGSSKDDA